MIKENENWRTAADHKEMARRVDAIRSTVLFANLPAEEQQALAAHLVHAPFAAGDIITSQGNVAHWLYLIIRGEAKVLMDSPKGRIQISTLRDGAFFGEMGMLTGEPRSATVVAVTAQWIAIDWIRPDSRRSWKNAPRLRRRCGHSGSPQP